MSGQTQENRVRLVILDELGLFRASLAKFLESQPGFEVTGQCGTSGEAFEMLKTITPDVVLLDFEIGTERGSDFISAARQAGYQGCFLIVAGTPDVRKSALALKVGASGIFLKSEPPERLAKAIRIVADDGVWVDPKVIQLLADELIDRCPPGRSFGGEERSETPLEEQERNVLLGILAGLSNRKIGDKLGISESRVKYVVQRLFAKTGVNTRSQLVRIALEGSMGAAEESPKWGASESAIADRARSPESRQQEDALQTVSQSHE